MMDFAFRDLDSLKDLRQLVDFLMKQSLGYPDYEGWVQRSEHEIDQGYKKAVLAFSADKIVGDAVYQPHKDLPRIREIKNLRVHPEVRNRFFASFMLRQAEVEGREEYDALLVDTRSDLHEMVALLRVNGYVPIATSPLYDPSVQDVTFVKCFDQRTRSGIMHSSKQFIIGKSL